MAIAILGWPINLIDPLIAQQVLEGSRSICREAGIILAGGHSIDSPEPIFGLAVTGKVKIEHLKQNNTANIGDKLFLTKKLGVGILTTAQKKGILKPEHEQIAPLQMAQLNKFGAVLGKLNYITALTDVTGFGLLGHLSEMCEGAKLSAKIDFNKVPKLPFIEEYLEKGSFPGGTTRNWDSYGEKINFSSDNNSEMQETQKYILADPQTSGGLLIAVSPNYLTDFQLVAKENGFLLDFFGEFVEKNEKLIYII
jgi:selenide,water dikinase